ncbi:MAG TPA: hypothetical protein PK024_06835 [Methanospirillum sp.]|uniref:hypothetical protein n=1 Tax=Methanospirillum sp. TaxID=45200 RepID=UPI002CF0F013|nr:hypothetical protein [Methanospirillum sp.]HOJ96531.1 hypothetical protein [Methanospirillum sp.]
MVCPGTYQEADSVRLLSSPSAPVEYPFIPLRKSRISFSSADTPSMISGMAPCNHDASIVYPSAFTFPMPS